MIDRCFLSTTCVESQVRSACYVHVFCLHSVRLACQPCSILLSTLACPGTFKQQHDTGQNLKYVIVYPHVACALAGGGGGGAAIGDGGAAMSKTPQSIMCSTDLEGFKKRVNSKVCGCESVAEPVA